MADAPLVPANWKLPDALRVRLGRSVGSQRVMQHEGHLLLISHAVPLPDDDDRKGILFWRDDTGEWRASNGDPGNGAIEILLDKYEKRIREFELDETSAKNADDYLRVLEGLAPIARSAKHLSKNLQDARKALPDATELIDLRDRAYDQARTAELNYQYTRDEMDVAVVRRAEAQAATSDRMAATAHRLNVMAAFFFPLATLSSIFGTTLTDNWSWSDSPLPFALMLGVGLLFGIFLTLLIGRSPTR